MRSYILGTALLALVACGDGTSPGSTPRVGLGFSAARTSMATADAGAVQFDGATIAGDIPLVTPTALGLEISRDGDVLLITRAELVVKSVKLKRATLACADDDDFDDAVAADGRDDDDDDDCPTIHIGPYLVNVPVAGTDGARVTVGVPEGTYTSVRLNIHKVTSSEPTDALFRQTNPDFRDISVRLEGVYNGTPFIFINDVNAKLNIPLESPLLIGEEGGDVTVSIDFSSWFLRASGGLYSPALANTPGTVRATVQNNIRSAFRAFRDRNRDGRED